MKIIKRIVLWSAISLAIQSCIFFAIDKYYEKSLLNTKVKEVRVDKATKPNKNLIITIPKDSKKIESSYDGKYLSYYHQNNLTVINTYDGTRHTINSEQNSDLIYNKWLPDVNSMFLCERDLSKIRSINVFTYDAENNNKQAPTDSNNHNIALILNGTKDNIDDVEMSTTMGIIYIKALKSNVKSDIFNISVNGNTSTIFNSRSIGKTAVFMHKPNLIYEDTTSNIIKITNSKWSLSNKACLINTDSEDKLYLGILNGSKVIKVLYGNIEKPISTWASLSLPDPLDKNDIIVTKPGNIYIKNTSDGNITDKKSNKKITYKGTLLSLTDKEILSIDNNKLVRKDLN